MPVPPAFPLDVLYDGSCRVCAAEMSRYRRMDQEESLRFVDIGAPDFDPARYGGTMDRFMVELHAIDATGRVYRGVEAFWAIWQAFPSSTPLGVLGRLVMVPGVHALARLGYRLFARYRYLLPRDRQACDSGSCRTGRHRAPR